MARDDRNNQRPVRRNLRQGKPNTVLAQPTPEPGLVTGATRRLSQPSPEPNLVTGATSRFSQPNPEPDLVTGAAPRRLSQPSPEPNLVTGAGERRTPAGIRQRDLRNVVSGAVEGQKDAKFESQLNQVTQQASDQLTAQRSAGKFNDVMENSQQINDEKPKPQGLRRIDREELRQGLADGSLGTFSVEGRDSSSLRSARDAAGISEDGSLVFDQRGLRRLSNRLSVVPSRQDDLTDPNVLARNLQAGLVTEDEATQISTAQANRVNQEKNRLEALGKTREDGLLSQDFAEQVASNTSDIMGLTGDQRIQPGVALPFIESVVKAGQAGNLPEGMTRAFIPQALAIAQSLRGAQSKSLGDRVANLFGVNNDIDTPQSVEPIVGLVRDIATSPQNQSEYEIGGQKVDLEDFPPNVRSLMLSAASTMRDGFARSAVATYAQTGSTEDLTDPERGAAEAMFEQDKESLIAQARESFMEQNKNRTLRPGPDDGRFSPFSPEQEKQLSTLKNMTLEEYLSGQMTGSPNGR